MISAVEDWEPYSLGSKPNASAPANSKHIAPRKSLFLKSFSNHIHLLPCSFPVLFYAVGVFFKVGCVLLFHESLSAELRLAETDGGWLPLHGNLTPAHACGCAAQCFEGVQRGSLFNPEGRSWLMRSHAHFPAQYYSLRPWGILAYLPYSSLPTGFVSVCHIKRIARCQRTYLRAVYQPGKALSLLKGLSSRMHKQPASGTRKGRSAFPNGQGLMLFFERQS
ncbi:hypothetical protein SDC9_80056 [bioreactor metagenome]|uniref:Uncharacterized protein n=1 Tax=bioreactor metagenome TaxID=1076179 RepID=A0A644YXY4_9ZZZZ